MTNSANIFITNEKSENKTFEYLLWFQPSLGWIVLTNDALDIILDNRYFAKTKEIDENHIKKIVWNNDLKINYINSRDTVWEIIKIIQDNTREISSVILDDNTLALDKENIEKETQKEITILRETFFKEKRIIKNHSELEKIEKAIKIIDKTFNYITELNKAWELKWKTENQIRWIIINKIFEFGGSDESFWAIVAFAKNSAMPHHFTWETIIEDWVLLIDMWAKFGWYCSDFTRTFWVWERNEQYEKFSEIHKIVKQAHLNAFENTTSWMTWKQIDNLTRKVIEDAWYWEKYIHSTGHWVGLDIHENPWINSKSEEEIKNGMVFTIEPWIYLEWEFWIRLEDIVIMEKGKLIKYSKVEL